jgi:hypothetical protein
MYKCTRDLYSIVFEGRLKFNNCGLYKRIAKDVYINNQGNIDDVSIEGWQEYFIYIGDSFAEEVLENINQQIEKGELVWK